MSRGHHLHPHELRHLQLEFARHRRPQPASNLETFLRKWIGDGRLQTYEDRERFRREAGELLAGLPSETSGWHGVEKLAEQRNAALLSLAKLLPYAQQLEPADAVEMEAQRLVVQEAEKALAGYVPSAETNARHCGVEFDVEGETYRCSLASGHLGGHGRIDLLRQWTTDEAPCASCVQAHAAIDDLNLDIPSGDVADRVGDLIEKLRSPEEPKEHAALLWLAESADPRTLTGEFAIQHARRALGMQPVETNCQRCGHTHRPGDQYCIWDPTPETSPCQQKTAVTAECRKAEELSSSPITSREVVPSTGEALARQSGSPGVDPLGECQPETANENRCVLRPDKPCPATEENPYCQCPAPEAI